MITVSDQDLVLAYKCNDVIDFSLSRYEDINSLDVDRIVNVICTEYTSEPFEEIMADLVKFMNDYPMNKDNDTFSLTYEVCNGRVIIKDDKGRTLKGVTNIEISAGHDKITSLNITAYARDKDGELITNRVKS